MSKCQLIFLPLLQTNSCDEIEVDIDQLSVSTLCKLERYASSILQSIRKKSGPSKPSATPLISQAPQPGTNGVSRGNPDATDKASTIAASTGSSSSEGRNDEAYTRL